MTCEPWDHFFSSFLPFFLPSFLGCNPAHLFPLLFVPYFPFLKGWTGQVWSMSWLLRHIEKLCNVYQRMKLQIKANTAKFALKAEDPWFSPGKRHKSHWGHITKGIQCKNCHRCGDLLWIREQPTVASSLLLLCDISIFKVSVTGSIQVWTCLSFFFLLGRQRRRNKRWKSKSVCQFNSSFSVLESTKKISLIDMQLTLCLTLKVSHGLFTDTVTPKTRLRMANPSLESVKPSAVWHSHSFLLSPPPSPVAWGLYPLSLNIGSSNILIPSWKLIFPLYASCSSVFYVAVTKTIMLLESELRQKHHLDQISLMRAGKSNYESVRLSLHFFFSLSCADGCPLLCSQTDGSGIRTWMFRNKRTKIIISDISIQPLVRATTRASKSIQANLDPSSYSLSFSSFFLFKLLGSLLVKIISNNLQCVEHSRNIKTPSCNDI